MFIDFNDEIFIPNGDVGDFAVVACDQFAASPEYWENIKALMPPYSALDYILPECYLAEKDERIAAIKRAAQSTPKDRFKAYRGAVYVTRRTAFGRTRHGIVASIELSAYDYAAGNKALIRASERTISSRIPPRVTIREAIDRELPHILLLTDDREGYLRSAAESAKNTVIYDGELKGNGGSVRGELISDGAPLYDAAEKIIAAARSRYGEELFALVGDGNHSLATAKYCAEHYPTPYNGKALVEIVDIYDEGLVFEPIHRLVKTDDKEKFIKLLRAAVGGDNKSSVYAPEPVEISLPSDAARAITEVDAFCEEYIAQNGGEVEYVHGDGALVKAGCVGIKMRGMQKSELFDCVLKNGVLPKKTFSLGEAEEKRYYIESRRIK